MKTVTVYARKEVGAEYVRWLHAQHDARITQVVIADRSDPSLGAAIDLGLRVTPWADRRLIERTDLSVSMLFPKRLRAAQIHLATQGAINFHPAPLPAYRGVGGYNLAILERLSSWAVSAHYMTADIDAGPIIAVDWFDMDPERETIATLMEKSNRALIEQARGVTRDAIESDAPLQTTPNVGGRYVDRNELEAMKRVEPGDDVARKVRAFWYPPFRGAYVQVDGHAYTLVSDDLLSTTLSRPGPAIPESDPN